MTLEQLGEFMRILYYAGATSIRIEFLNDQGGIITLTSQLAEL